jgi:hypothetical protein
MSQYTLSFCTEHGPGCNYRHTTRDPTSGSRAWTIASDGNSSFHARSRVPRLPYMHEESLRSQGPSRSQYKNSRPLRRNSRPVKYNPEPLLRIHSPPPSSRSPADGAPTFLAWLQSSAGPHLTHEDATHVLSLMTWNELLQNERKAALERSVAAQSRTEYSQSVYSSQASPSAYGGHQGPRFPPPMYEDEESKERIERWVDDMRKTEIESRYSESSKPCSKNKRD